MNLIWISPAFSDYDPIKIVFDSTGKTLFAHKQYFHDFLRKEITLQKLVELTQCENIYRNTNDIISNENTTIDKGSLWKAIGKDLVLVDDDQYITAQLNKLLFEIAE